MDRREFIKSAAGIVGAILFCPGMLLEELPGIPAMPAPQMTGLLSPDLIARESLRILQENLALVTLDWETATDGQRRDRIKIRRRPW